ncbi:F-box domain-containing protein [Mycena indigotica]|uniref:F-box domain-containing protein n=1 Tax=Mycena indigotica TaxID=2126181 RepID=A0A8H6W1F6_9AGAR|nr:F-box domain-containing protein [Mycena indigotica]KAF7302024.1 F-box domain-containing protein [Mycena indigotica]
MSTRRAQIDALEKEILRGEQRLQGLRRRLDVLRAEAVYPVLSLPTEITTEIFCHCALAFPKTAPLTLVRVCSSWRAVAMETPLLWSTVSLLWDRHANDRDVVEFLETFVERAAHCVLDLELTVLSPVIDIAKMVGFITALKRCSPQMRTWTVKMPGAFATGFNSLILNRFPDLGFSALEELTFIRTGENWDVPSIDIFQPPAAPKLSRVSLSSLPPTELNLEAGWQNVFDFVAEDVALVQCLHTLQETTRLKSCILRDLIFDPNGSAAHAPTPLGNFFLQPLTLDSLTRLTLIGGNAIQLLRFASFPMLDSLELVDVVHGLDDVLDHFFERSLCPLQHLTIRPLASDHDSTVSIHLSMTFGVLPISTLSISHPSTSLTIALLQPEALETPKFLPYLRSLALYDCPAAKFPSFVAAVGEQLERRVSTAGLNSSVETIRVISGRPYPYLPKVNDEMLAPLDRLRKRGIQIEVGEFGPAG